MPGAPSVLAALAFTFGPPAPQVSLADVTSVPAAPGLVTMTGSSAVVGSGPLRRFAIEVERGARANPVAFADSVERTLLDPRGWTGAGRLALQRVDSGVVDLRVTLATPRTVDRLCFPLHTAGFADCFNRGRAVINIDRWTQGTVPYAGALGDYRDYLVNHEFGHGLGHGHEQCPGPGRRSFVMMQQTGTTFGCRRQPWPRASEQRLPLVPPRILVLPGTTPDDGGAAGVAFLQALGAPDRRLDVRVLAGPADLTRAALKRAAALVLLDTAVPAATVRRFERAGVGVVSLGSAAGDPSAPAVCRRRGAARVVSDGAGSLATDWTTFPHQALVAGALAWVLGLTERRPCR
ncbi:MAG: hypothetical protein JWN32_4399 [Solirubrobacterales bacterium]|nr:hypothetical protein [Solirubrobacterales bacterium]